MLKRIQAKISVHRSRKHCKRSSNQFSSDAMAVPNSEEHYVHAMVLSGVGDALGYKDGEWEFCHSGSEIYKQLTNLGGLSNIKVKVPKWVVSDDTVMHLATGEALAESSGGNDREKMFTAIAVAYKECMSDMAGRAPGATCMSGARMLKPNIKNGYRIPFNPRGGGCGGAMRAMCIGLRYPKPEQLDDLIAVSVEAGRMTHHHPVGYLGSLAAALFTAYAVQGRPARSWGQGLLETLPLALKYVESTGHCVQESKDNWEYFVTAWQNYLESRNLTDGNSDPVFPEPYGFQERDQFVKKVSFSGWGGASGHDAPMIAYDAYLGAGSSWEQLCYRSMFHGGDSDSTGVIAACWFGVAYGVAGVPDCNYKYVEYKDRLATVGRKLYALAFPEDTSKHSAKVGDVCTTRATDSEAAGAGSDGACQEHEDRRDNDNEGKVSEDESTAPTANCEDAGSHDAREVSESDRENAA